MEIVVRTHRIDWNEKLRKRVLRSVLFAVDRYKDHISRITIYLADLNGPRGGVDKLCQLTAEIRGASPVLILEQGAEMPAVAARAARRLGYRIGRRTQRRRASHQREARATIRAPHNPERLQSEL